MSDQLTREQIAELERLLKAATPGPWLVHGPSADPSADQPVQWQHHYEIRVDDGNADSWPFRIAVTPVHSPQLANDYALIAALRNAAPALLASAAARERQDALIKEARELLTWAIENLHQLGEQADEADAARAFLSRTLAENERPANG